MVAAPKDVVDTAVAAGTFKTLVAAVQAAGLETTLRGTGPFTRVLRLPVEVDADRVSATLRDGVLTIQLPKAEAAKPRKINVRAK